MADIQYKYDVFLSHNSKDKAAVEKIARVLRDEYQLKVWLDKWNLIPGKDSQEDLEKGLNECETIAVFIGETGFGKWENKEMRVAITQNANDESRRVIPVFLPGAPEDAQLPPLLGIHTWVNLRTGFDTKDSLYLLHCGIIGKEPGDYSNPNASNTEVWNLKHPYPMPPNFTGRLAERTMLTQWLDGDSENRLFILRALGGFGKSALAWQWLTHDVNPKTWKKVVFWSFYEGDASFEHFVEETLKYLKVEVPQGKRDQVDTLLHAMQTDNILIIMDGFERALRAYNSINAAYQGDEEPKLDDNQLDCVDVNTETFLKSICSLPKIQSKVLMTTRLTPRAIKPRGEFMVGCHEIELTAMQKADAVEFFHKQGIKGNRAEIESACEPYGYHPLSLRLLAGRILKDFQNPGDISVAQTLKIDGDLKQHQNHVLKIAHESLSPQQQRLLGQIACFRSPVELPTLVQISKPVQSKGVFGFFKKTLNLYAGKLETDLNDLIERGLLQRTTRLISNHPISIFDLHPIVRRFAYDKLTAADRTGAHEQLVNYFDAIPKPEKVEKLEDLAPVIELYHHMVGAGNLDEACDLLYDRINKPTYYQFGAYQLRIELLRALFLDGEDKPPRLKDERSQAWTLNGLANSYSLSGQPRRAVPLFEMQIAIREKQGVKKSVAIGLGNVADDQLKIGALSAAERNLRRQIDLCREIADEFREAAGHQELGRVLSYRGAWQEAETIPEKGIELARKQDNKQIECVIVTYSAHRAFLMKNYSLAIEKGKIAKQLADIPFPGIGVLPRDQIRAAWILGAAYRANNELILAEENLSKALNLCRQINMVDHEADILLGLARLRYAQGDFKDAQEKASEALVITERSGYVLQGADVNLFLAQYALEQEKDNAKAKVYAEEAKKLATCDGPPYYYKVAYEEAEAMLEKL